MPAIREVLADKITSTANRRGHLELFIGGALRMLLRAEQPGIELLPAGATPDTPPAGRVVFFARDNGAGKVQVCMLPPSGLVQILGTEA